MKLPYIKMCGFTNPFQARQAVMLGADLIGLNFFAESPRAVSFGLAVKIQQAVHKASAERGSKRPARTVAVMVNADVEHVLGVLKHVEPDILQFHGDEAARICQYFRHPFIKAFRLKSASDATRIPEYMGGYAVGFLVEAFSDTEFGGTGRVLSYSMASAALKYKRGFLAGGLNPKNVGEAVRMLKPYGVDVASGIESRPGVKSRELMADFVDEVRRAAKTAR
ncbi:MAG: N-(5'-phosphoribosyl)anthranilate isomerase [Proteobacteria bacterium]|nr:MAG: N-(5'-phosphoribosyl)anthranilate isomerase [Pseudomonadota bacterium]